MSIGKDPSATFRQEAEDLFQQLEQALLDLERRPGDLDLVGTVFRALHTIKGSGSMFGFDALAGFTHHVETVFQRVRAGELAVGPALIGATLAARDHMRGLLDGSANAADGEALLAALAAAERREGARTVTAAPATRYRIRFTLPADEAKPLVDELLALGEGSTEADGDAWTVTLATRRPRSDIDTVFLFNSQSAGLVIEEVAPPAPPPPSPKPAAPLESVVKVPAERIDGLMDQVGELVIAEARLRQLSQRRDDPELLAVAEEIERLTASLRETSMGIRMVPIGALFGRFRRVVRDLSHELGKEVRLVTQGEETELDKAMVEHLHDPLIHLIRNAVDHGIEDGPGRAAGRKRAEGTVMLSADHYGAEVLITVSDDGKGLDRGLIRAKAEALGLLHPGAEITDAELFDFIFRPGFSTAERVSSVSGRGVGMDVVKTALESMRGVIEVSSQPNLGTAMTLRLPLTLAIIDGLLVRIADQRFVIPLSAVEECVELPGDIDPNCNFLTLRDDLVPFIRLRELFEMPDPRPAAEKVVIAISGEHRTGLVVDQLLGGHQTVVKSLGRLHRGVRCVSGATILGDGSVALILDVLNLIAMRQAQEDEVRREAVAASERNVD
ncbi:MAG: chemotaxis protein CheA [Actinomycetota bacterium]